MDAEQIDEVCRKRDDMIGEICALHQDIQTLHRIGDKSYNQYISQYTEFMSVEMINMCDRIEGHPIAVIKYYCDKFNKGSDE